MISIYFKTITINETLQLKQSISIEKFVLKEKVFFNAFQFNEFVPYKDTLVLDKNETVNTSDIQTV